jgi:hypothetical protein
VATAWLPASLEDARADEPAEGRAARRWVVLACVRCGDRGILNADGLCPTCEDNARWAAYNRAMCDLLHRGACSPPARGLSS